MAEKRDRRPRNEERPEMMDDEQLRGSVEDDDDEFEEDDEVEGEDDLDEDIIDEEASGQDRTFTSEIGSEGGSAGDKELRRPRAGVVRGSETTETGRPSSDVFRSRDRK